MRIVSLTVTEGGYNYNPSTGEFQFETEAVAVDLGSPCFDSAAEPNLTGQRECECGCGCWCADAGGPRRRGAAADGPGAAGQRERLALHDVRLRRRGAAPSPRVLHGRFTVMSCDTRAATVILPSG